MEVGAVKQAFNNEVILLKKKLNQAKIQIIHKLTRKAKQLAEKKAPEPLKEKLKRKAESAVNEVLILKKIKPKDLAKFIVTHKGDLKDFLNKPVVDNDKACARLLLHKALQDKYKFIRGRFSNVPIQDLFMSRLERRKLKKEEKEKQKNKKKGKNNKVVNSEGDWNVEDVVGNKKEFSSKNDNQNEVSDEDEENDSQLGNVDDGEVDKNRSKRENESESEHSETENESDDNAEDIKEEAANVSESEEEDSEPEVKQVSKPVKINSKVNTVEELQKHSVNAKNKPVQRELKTKPKAIPKKNPEKKQKDIEKVKNFNEKIQQRKLTKDLDAPIVGNKIVDPFFITSTGENYLSVVEPRGPDEVKEEHKQGNRKLRRAVMFGYVPKPKPRYDNNNYRDDNRFNKQNGFDKGDNYRSKFNNRQEGNDRKSFNNDFNDRKRFNDKSNDEKPEKLHPSWEAKKKKSGILPFEGKKIVFD